MDKNKIRMELKLVYTIISLNHQPQPSKPQPSQPTPSQSQPLF
jgi:hypothetical protein